MPPIALASSTPSSSSNRLRAMPSQPIALGPKWFASKKAAYTFVKKFMTGLELDETIAYGEMDWLRPLLWRHPTPGKLDGWDNWTATVVRNPENQQERVLAICLPENELRVIGVRKCVFAGSADGPNSPQARHALAVAMAENDEAAFEAALVEHMVAAGL